MNKRKYKNKKMVVWMTGGILLCILLLFLILMILKVTKSGESLGKKDISFPDRVATLENFDTGGITKYGWLQIEGTMIDLPILSPYTEGNIDYNYGWISPSSIGKKNRKVLIGHNVLNVSNHPMLNESILTDFEDLMAFVYYNFAKEHMYLSYTENGENHIFVIYGIGFYNYDYDNAEGFDTEEEVEEYIKKVKKESIYQYDVDVKKNDNIITIKTCTRFFGLDEKQQFVIDARELREGEVPKNYNINKTKLYQEYGLKDYYTKNDTSL